MVTFEIMETEISLSLFKSTIGTGLAMRPGVQNDQTDTSVQEEYNR